MIATSSIVLSDRDDIQGAIDALPSQGGVIRLGPGIYEITDTIYMPTDRPCSLEGAGAWTDTAGGGGTAIKMLTADTDIIHLRGNDSSIRNLSLIGPDSHTASDELKGRGIVVGRRDYTDPYPPEGADPANTEIDNGGAGNVLVNAVVEDVCISLTNGWAIFIAGTEATLPFGTANTGVLAAVSLSIFTTFNRVRVIRPQRYGGVYVGKNNTTARFVDCQVAQVNKNAGLDGSDGYYGYVGAADMVTFDRCTFEGYCPGTYPFFFIGNLSTHCTLRNCWFEEDAGDTSTDAAPTWFVEVEDGARMPVIAFCMFSRDSVNATRAGKLRLIKFDTTSDTHLSGQIIAPMAASAVAVLSGGSPIEENHIDTGGNNIDVCVVGAGIVGDPIGYYPLQYASDYGVRIGNRMFKPQEVADSDFSNTSFQYDVNGNITMNWNMGVLGGNNIGALEYFWGGSKPGRRLIGNMPTFSRTLRDARSSWVDGDAIIVSDGTAPGLQIRIGGAWNHFGAGTVNGAGD